MENEEIEVVATTGGGLDALDRIGIEALGLEQQQQAAEDAITDPEPEEVMDPAKAWAQLPFMLGGMLSMALPELRDVYTEPACLAWGKGMAAVAQKYGWDASETVARFGPECMLIMASIPLIVPTVGAIKARQAAVKALKGAPAQGQGGESAVAGPNNAPEEVNSNPMLQPPGNFSVPT